MTNETTVVEKVTGAIGAQFNEGRETASQITTWVTEKGLDFALNLVFALVILLVGWLAIKLIAFTVRKALMRGKAKGRLLADFTRRHRLHPRLRVPGIARQPRLRHDDRP